MKLLTFVDVHGDTKAVDRLVNLAKKEKPDFLVCAGDISEFGENLKFLLECFKGFNLIIIPGNHEDENHLKELCEKLGFIYLHKGCYEFNEYKFFGYGSGGFCKTDCRFESLAKKFKKLIKPGDKTILVTHAPPYGTNLDDICNEHMGCKSYTKFIKEAKIHLCICGHLHETSGNIDNIGKSTVINPGKHGRIITI